MKKKDRKKIKFTPEKPINYGFIPDTIQPDHYIFGAGQIEEKILQLDGQWDNFLPVDELQNHGFETYCCTSFGTLNCLEALIKRKYNM